MGETCRKLPFRAIGERFELAGLIYEVQESDIGYPAAARFYTRKNANVP